MGILNVTPDSFSDGGLFEDSERAILKALEMAEEGADLIDVGGESSRPGAEPVSAQDELARVVPIVEALSSKGIVVSVDTTKAEVAEASIEAGAEIINDISAMTASQDMAGVVRDSGAGVILMHMRGTPKTMQLETEYDNLTEEVVGYLRERLDYATSVGIDIDKIALDPGIGFGKTSEGNLELIKNLGNISSLGCPVVLGASRKSFIGTLMDLEIDKRLQPSVAIAAIGVMNGANIVRVHDVRETVEAVTIADAIRNLQ